jgi:hypothetical protein
VSVVGTTFQLHHVIVNAVIFGSLIMHERDLFCFSIFEKLQQGDDPNCFHSREGDFVTVRPHPAFELQCTGFGKLRIARLWLAYAL